MHFYIFEFRQNFSIVQNFIESEIIWVKYGPTFGANLGDWMPTRKGTIYLYFCFGEHSGNWSINCILRFFGEISNKIRDVDFLDKSSIFLTKNSFLLKCQSPL